MQALKFTLEGKNAFFKKPDVNTYLYFTYGHIHKVALLGILGAVLGYKGYNQMRREMDCLKKEIDFPEFYSKLSNLKVGIVPNNKNGVIDKKLNVFNNSVGYYNKDKNKRPCNLVVKEQWLENASWDIYILLDNEESVNVKEALLNRNFIYVPYLGKNDHLADIKNIEILECSNINNINEIHSFFKKDDLEINNYSNDDDLFYDLEDLNKESYFKYEEMLPIELDKEMNRYLLTPLVYTNMPVKCLKEDAFIFKVKNSIIQFI